VLVALGVAEYGEWTAVRAYQVNHNTTLTQTKASADEAASAAQDAKSAATAAKNAAGYELSLENTILKQETQGKAVLSEFRNDVAALETFGNSNHVLLLKLCAKLGCTVHVVGSSAK
jgi:hypothetical protein